MPNYIPVKDLPEFINCPSFEVACAVRIALIDMGMQGAGSNEASCFLLLHEFSKIYFTINRAGFFRAIGNAQHPLGTEFLTARAFLDFITVKPLMVGRYEVSADTNGFKDGFNVGCQFVSWDTFHEIAKLEPATKLHNPQNVPAPKDGCRFLDVDEVGEEFKEQVQQLYMWANSSKIWNGQACGIYKDCTYSTPLSREALAEARSPKKDKPADVVSNPSLKFFSGLHAVPRFNPFNIPVEKIGDDEGWRLLNENEYAGPNETIQYRMGTTQYWNSKNWSGDRVNCGAYVYAFNGILRTKLTPAELLLHKV